MKTCRVEFEYDEELARAVASRYGNDRPATHEEMRNWFQRYGESADTDVLIEMREGERSDDRDQ
jgi:hypothetical protein